MSQTRVSPSNRPTSAGGLSAHDELEMDRIVQEDMGRRSANRPSSAQSRQAWHDNEGMDMDDGPLDNSFGHGDFPDDDDHVPTAMEGEVYVDGHMRVLDAQTKAKLEEPQGCCSKVGRAIRSLWRTRQTEDTKADRELHVKTTLRELIIYIIFVVVLCIVTFGMTSSTMYYYTKVMSELFLDSQFPETKNTYRGMTNMMDWWRFSQGPLLDGLYWEQWYNGENLTDDEQGYIYYENKLLGVPRIRQLKVRNDSCFVHSDFESEIKQCYDHYSESVEEKNPFGKMNGTAWVYSTEEELDGSGHWGKLASYGGGGYYEDLTHTKGTSSAKIYDLKDNLWLDRGTRVAFVDFTVYNANINLFCVVRLVTEFPPTGGAIPSWDFRTVKLLRYVSAFDYFILACEGIFCLFIAYYVVEEILEIKLNKWSYFKSVWNCLDLLVIGLSLVCIAFSLYRTNAVDKMLISLLEEPDKYADFEYLSYWQNMYNNMLAVLVFFAWIKVFKYISFNKTMTQLSSTLSRCGKDLMGFSIMFLIVFFAYAQLGYLIFGTQIDDFKSFGDSIFTLFRIILGDFDFHELEQANRIMGPIFFCTYVFFVFFVLLNMFLAIINDTYSEVKADIATQKSEFEITDYFKRGYEKMLGKLNFKRDKIVDIQKALAQADVNNDQQLDFDEWRHELKARGHADAEIEAVFAKYDVDGDRVLDAEEQARMASDLQEQKAELTNEIAEVEEAAATGGRPGTARSKSRVSFNDGSDSEGDDDGGRRGRPAAGVSYEEFTVLSRRVDRMEHSIGSIVSKIDAVLVKLEAMERAKLKRRETMGKLLDSITEEQQAKRAGKSVDGLRPVSAASSFYDDEDERQGHAEDTGKREQMERLVREELERWDSEASITQASGGRSASAASKAQGKSSGSSRPGSASSNRNVTLEDLDPHVPDPSGMTSSNV
ncbi:polycystin-2-like protein 1 isoform X3 [Ptychodera flava]|uniref:polycystin-2-like protein 1 isoform X3 n=1 Tax=Ptychodera flava TaxID=63121 RepID=UPI00396A0680